MRLGVNSLRGLVVLSTVGFAAGVLFLRSARWAEAGGSGNGEKPPAQKIGTGEGKRPEGDDPARFTITPTTSTTLEQIHLAASVEPGFPKLLDVRTAAGTERAWLLPLYIPKTCTVDRSDPGNTVVTVAFYDCLYHQEAFRAIKDAVTGVLKGKAWDRAEPIGNQVTVFLNADVEGKLIPLQARTFTRSPGKKLISVKFEVHGPANEVLRKTNPKDLGVSFAERYYGQYRTNDLEATLENVSNAAYALSNQIGSDPRGSKAALLVCFGGTVDQKAATRQLVQRSLSLEVSIRQGKEVNPALVERVVTALFDLTKEIKLSDMKEEKEVMTVLLSNGAKMTAAIGTFKRMAKDIKKEVEEKKEATDAISGKNRMKYERDVTFEGGFNYLGIGGNAGGGVRYMEENDVESAISRTRNSASRDLQQLAQAIEGELPVAALTLGQLQALKAAKVDKTQFVLSTFVHGQKTLTHTYSFQNTEITLISSPGTVEQITTKKPEEKPDPAPATRGDFLVSVGDASFLVSPPQVGELKGKGKKVQLKGTVSRLERFAKDLTTAAKEKRVWYAVVSDRIGIRSVTSDGIRVNVMLDDGTTVELEFATGKELRRK